MTATSRVRRNGDTVHVVQRVIRMVFPSDAQAQLAKELIQKANLSFVLQVGTYLDYNVNRQAPETVVDLLLSGMENPEQQIFDAVGRIYVALSHGDLDLVPRLDI